MAKSISIHPKECAGGSSYGCGIRWEILGSSKRLGIFLECLIKPKRKTT